MTLAAAPITQTAATPVTQAAATTVAQAAAAPVTQAAAPVMQAAATVRRGASDSGGRPGHPRRSIGHRDGHPQRRGRLRTDLGGIYFNGLFSLAAMAAFIATGYAPLLVLIAGQQIIMLDQFTPWIRLDGYHVVSDLIGVSDLFERIRPILAGLWPGRPPHPRVTELKPWAKAAVTIWVIATIGALGGLLVLLALKAPGFATSGWASIVFQVRDAARAIGHGQVATAILGVLGIVLLVLPVLAVLYLYLSLCRGAGSRLALHRENLTLARRVTTAESGEHA